MQFGPTKRIPQRRATSETCHSRFRPASENSEKPPRLDHRPVDPLPPAGGEQIRHRRRRGEDDGQIDAGGQCVDGGVDGDAVDLAGAEAHPMDGSLVTEGEEIVDDAGGQVV